jgi:hypothetical protein
MNLEAAVRWIVRRAGHQLLYWPDPERAYGYAHRNERKRRDARYAYLKALEEGDKEWVAVRKAAEFASCTRRAVRRWRHSPDWQTEAQGQPQANSGVQPGFAKTEQLPDNMLNGYS